MSEITIHKVLLSIVLTIVLSSCSQVPYPTTYNLSSQKVMQAAEHWQVLAIKAANKISETIPSETKFFINKQGKEPFYTYFADFLEQELLNKNYRVSSSNTNDCLPIMVQAKVLEHGKRAIDVYPGLIPQVTGAVVSSLTIIGGTSTGDLSHDEVLITIRIVNGDQTIFAENNVYYIGEDEIWHYDNAPSTTGIKIPNKNVKVIGE